MFVSTKHSAICLQIAGASEFVSYCFVHKKFNDSVVIRIVKSQFNGSLIFEVDTTVNFRLQIEIKNDLVEYARIYFVFSISNWERNRRRRINPIDVYQEPSRLFFNSNISFRLVVGKKRFISFEFMFFFILILTSDGIRLYANPIIIRF